MKRYTKKLEKPIGPLKYCIDNSNDAVGATQKLGEVEDWEELIGMPLDALAKLEYSNIEDLYIISDNKVIKCEIIDVNECTIILSGKKVVLDDDNEYAFDFKDYFKRWFFTKEEAESVLRRMV